MITPPLYQDNSALLGKDALELWIRALRSSAQMSEPLFRLLDLLPPLFTQPDFSPEACRVAQESALMASQQVMMHYGLTLMTEFAEIVGDPMSALILHPITAIDVMIQAMHSQQIQAADWARLLVESGLFSALLNTLINVRDSSIVSGYFVGLLARICYMTNGTRLFMDMVQSASYRLKVSDGQVGEQILKPMIDQWCKRFENMASSRKRKITCLGLASLLAASEPNTDPQVYDSIPEMIGVWMDMFGDLREDSNGEPPPLPNAPPSSPSAIARSCSQRGRSPSPAISILGLEGLDDDGDWLEDTSPGKARMTDLGRMDPVNTVRLTSFVAASLNRAQQKGQEAFQAALAKMDSVVLEILQKDLAR